MRKYKRHHYKKVKKLKSSQYQFTKLRDGASRVTMNQNGQMRFGYPRMSQTIFPGQVCRINTGW